ncbi:MAG: hypothetical protein EB060_04010 [Proteobacteria bacterium]|nr:hypothetical protein [Pseudomonadota bacterium]
MKLIFKLAQPKDDKEALFNIEALVEDMQHPGIAYISLGGQEYVIEIHFDQFLFTKNYIN